MGEINKKWYHKVPGFRSNTRWKQISAGSVYGIFGIGIIGGITGVGEEPTEVAEEAVTVEEAEADTESSPSADEEQQQREEELEQKAQELEEKEQNLQEQQEQETKEESNSDQENETSNSSSEEETSEADSASSSSSNSLSETVNVGAVAYQINDVSTTSTVGSEYLSETADGTYIVLDVVYTNNGNEAAMIDSSQIKLKQDGKTFESDGTATTYANSSDDPSNAADFFLSEVNPGSSLEGEVVFDVAEEVADAEHLEAEVSEGFFGTNTAAITLK